ncbi:MULTISPECIES: alanine--tRNA ligase [unclassified Ectothiorhodospira]|uniref:alanine--tRNA ligase n=1 Tax=unclassified Ectothiorhodospira TaxID=2684909 RepID=UPI001EE8E604|nr:MULTISPECIES: alanine--tRNA ligase [unclassified Ectothiorhodospira]MCG5516219.1 alanine--tRNA ligase [Ectothiorhodospira sp. 9100]MCG5519628.1 alanine--tRNA ligase [Ectothiorhodospira sp. 9905]
MKSADIRTSFLEYFRSKGHEVVASAPLVPGNDPTLLFTNAGMVQFKETFLGLEQRAYQRATSSQRCVRAGGKHNDLENVGYTARHHTFFEMLGNFSFGDYFKRDAIHYAWEYLTQVLKMPADKLWVTVYETDDEAYDIWVKEIGVPADRVTRIGDEPGGGSDNFWQMGDTGPCGPCTEVFYDHGPGVWGGPPGSPEADGDRYIEIWNLVFMQYDRDSEGTLTPLPKPSVDTGMGLERLAAVLQGVHSNYEIDLFQNLLDAVGRIMGSDDTHAPSYKVIADHIRSCSFLITDGVMPANEGRGYVLRRIIRRAARHGHKLGMTDPFFHRLVEPLVREMGEAYPELAKAQKQVERVLLQEEERFRETLEHGLKHLEEGLDKVSDKTIPGGLIFKLYDTYGFPVDLTGDIAREKGLELDMAGFEHEMEQQRDRARAASSFRMSDAGTVAKGISDSRFVGYEHIEEQARVLRLAGSDGKPVDSLNGSSEGSVVLDVTPFYGESGGQVGDTGFIEGPDGLFQVNDTVKQGGVFIHRGTMLRGTLETHATVSARVDGERRRAVVLNHSATHLLHAALREVLGEHVQQKGSLVAPDRLRFDFSHFEPISSEQLARIERMVNHAIRANAPAEARVMPIKEALEAGAMALFGEKYGDEVRVLSLGDFSVELCGGIHVQRTGDIGVFKVISEGGVASGIRRIEAVTGDNALDHMDDTEKQLDEAARMLRAGRGDLIEKIQQVLDRHRSLEKELEAMKAKLASQAGSSLTDQAVEVNGVKVLAARMDEADPKSLRDTVDQLKNKLGEAIIVLATARDGKVSLVAGVTAGHSSTIKAGELVNQVAQQVGGKGGGRPDMAMAGGNRPEALDEALASVKGWVESRL